MELKKINETTYNAGKILSNLPQTITIGKSTYVKMNRGCSDSGNYCNKQIEKYKSGGKSAIKIKFTDNFGTHYQVYVKRMKGGHVPKVGKVKLLAMGYNHGKDGHKYYEVSLDVDGTSVSILKDLTQKGIWYVTWGLFVDFVGNKRDLIKQYPDLRKYIEAKVWQSVK